MIEIDITELLEEYVRLLENSGVPRTSTESKIMWLPRGKGRGREWDGLGIWG